MFLHIVGIVEVFVVFVVCCSCCFLFFNISITRFFVSDPFFFFFPEPVIPGEVPALVVGVLPEARGGLPFPVLGFPGDSSHVPASGGADAQGVLPVELPGYELGSGDLECAVGHGGVLVPAGVGEAFPVLSEYSPWLMGGGGWCCGAHAGRGHAWVHGGGSEGGSDGPAWVHGGWGEVGRGGPALVHGGGSEGSPAWVHSGGSEGGTGGPVLALGGCGGVSLHGRLCEG